MTLAGRTPTLRLNDNVIRHCLKYNLLYLKTIAVLGTNADEILVEGAKLFRGNPGPGEHDLVNGFNAQMAEVFGG